MPERGSRLVHAAVRGLSGGGSVLCFHSIAGPAHPSASETHVPLAILAAAISVARQTGEVVPLSELLQRHRRGLVTAGLTAITFDDAYAALAGEAADLLSAAAVPVTVFVTGEAARDGRTFWWDRVDDLLPRVSGERWRRFEQDCGVPEAYRGGQPAEYGPGRPLRQWILAVHRGRWPEALEGALQALEADVGYRTVQRSMSFAEIRALATRLRMEIGVHTLTHPVLPLLPAAEAVEEIGACHRLLQQELESVLPVLAIPFGLFDRSSSAVAEAAGMKACLTLQGTTLRGALEPELVPRFCVMRGVRPWKLALSLAGVADRVRAWRSGGELGDYPALPSATT